MKTTASLYSLYAITTTQFIFICSISFDITQGMEAAIDFIYDTRHLCTCFRIDGIKAMSRGISGVTLANTSNRGRI